VQQGSGHRGQGWERLALRLHVGCRFSLVTRVGHSYVEFGSV
jgi:hypothetical protein